MYRETAFERDGRHSNENARRVYLQRPTSQAEAEVAGLSTPIIMPRPPRRSCTDQSKSYAYDSSDGDGDEERPEASKAQSSVGEACHLTESFEFDDDQDDEQGPPIKRRRLRRNTPSTVQFPSPGPPPPQPPLPPLHRAASKSTQKGARNDTVKALAIIKHSLVRAGHRRRPKPGRRPCRRARRPSAAPTPPRPKPSRRPASTRRCATSSRPFFFHLPVHAPPHIHHPDHVRARIADLTQENGAWLDSTAHLVIRLLQAARKPEAKSN